jgi:CRP-like cAMP-binding protein
MANQTLYDPSMEIARGNLTLCQLSPDVLEVLLPHLEPVDMPQGVILVHPGHPIRWVYFLTEGMAAITNTDAEGTAVELGVIGREGILGFQALLGPFAPQNTLSMQFGGRGLRVQSSTLLIMLRSQPEILHGLHRFLYALQEQTSRLVLCNRLHDLESRLARWLLVTSDTLGTAYLHLTQEFLANALGTARPGVTIAAGSLQRSGSITYSRGRVEIRDRELLQGSACDCYAVIRAVYHEVYPQLF